MACDSEVVRREWIRADVVSAIFSTPTGTVRQWVHSGRIPHKKVGRACYFHLPTLREWYAQGGPPPQTFAPDGRRA